MALLIKGCWREGFPGIRELPLGQLPECQQLVAEALGGELPGGSWGALL